MGFAAMVADVGFGESELGVDTAIEDVAPGLVGVVMFCPFEDVQIEEQVGSGIVVFPLLDVELVVVVVIVSAYRIAGDGVGAALAIAAGVDVGQQILAQEATCIAVAYTAAETEHREDASSEMKLGIACQAVHKGALAVVGAVIQLSATLHLKEPVVAEVGAYPANTVLAVDHGSVVGMIGTTLCHIASVVVLTQCCQAASGHQN